MCTQINLTNMICEDQSLSLGLGFPSSPKTSYNHNFNYLKPSMSSVLNQYETSLSLSLSGDQYQNQIISKVEEPHCRAACAATVKRERPETTASSEDHFNLEFDHPQRRVSSRGSDEFDEEDDSTDPITTKRKKLRLTKEQSALLEESFKQHSTLNPKQKKGLAERLDLRPRQVEVWFQNRRARTKLKQTEVNCEYLKKWCEILTDENRRLHKELQELKAAMKLSSPSSQQPFYMAATLTMCPSCERIAVPIATNINNPSKSTAYVVNSHIYSSFTNPSPSPAAAAAAAAAGLFC